MKIDPFLLKDVENISHLQPAGWYDIIPHFIFYASTPYCHPIKMTLEDKITGIGCAIKFPSSGWLAHIIVDPSFRNKGIGTSITKYLMEWLQRENNNPLQLIATDMGEPVYLKLGFKTITEYVFFSGSLSLNPNQHMIYPYEKKFTDQIFQLDQNVSGDDRRELLEPHLPTMKLYMENQQILGFYAPKLGEGMILAKQPVAGFELLRTKHFKNYTRTVFPIQNLLAFDFFKNNGFLFERKAVRMALGKKLRWRPEFVYSRIGGNLG